MTTNIHLRKTVLTDEQKEMLIKKVSKLDKYFNDDVVSDIVVSEQQNECNTNQKNCRGR